MQKGVLIKEGPDVVEKRSYGGDTSRIEENLIKEGVIYEIYDDMDPLFVDAVIKHKETKDQADWKSLNSVAEKISFIAKRLGFE